MDEVITSRFSEELVKKLDETVKHGHFQNRSEALRTIIEEYLREHPELFLGTNTSKQIEEAPDLSEEELEDIGRRLFPEGIVRLVAEGRERV